MSKLHDTLKRHEGVRSHAYECSAGYTTIGVGRNIDANGGLGLSDDEVSYLLSNDIARCVAELDKAFPWYSGLDQVRQEAMINLCFNLGMTRLLKFQNALAAMADADYEKAASEFLDSRWATQVGGRAGEVASMIRAGAYS